MEVSYHDKKHENQTIRTTKQYITKGKPGIEGKTPLCRLREKDGGKLRQIRDHQR